MNFSVSGIFSDFFKLLPGYGGYPRLLPVQDRHGDVLAQVGKPWKHWPFGPREARHHAVKRRFAAGIGKVVKNC